jgi:hypothetical protein
MALVLDLRASGEIPIAQQSKTSASIADVT